MLARLLHHFLARIQASGNRDEMSVSVEASRNRRREVEENPVETQGVCRVPTWKAKRFCPNKERFMISMNGKVIKLFKENVEL